MLSIGAGAQQEVIAFIEQLGVRHLRAAAASLFGTDDPIGRHVKVNQQAPHPLGQRQYNAATQGTAMPMAPGTCLGPYHVLARLGEGLSTDVRSRA